MPRKARITVPGHVHHVMTRGIEARSIFRSDSDREILKSLIGKNIEKSGYLLYAWCFMDNHYHLVIRINNYPLALFMRSINGPYAQYFRKRIKTRGYLFQDRYKSIVCQDQNYLQELVRYVHLNPVRGGICKTVASLKKYKWCGHSVLMGVENWGIQNCADVLNRFNRNHSTARIKYEQFVKDGIDKRDDLQPTLYDIKKANNEIENQHDLSCWVIGNHDYVKQVLKQQEQIRKRLSRGVVEGVSLDSIASDVCKKLGVNKADIFKKSRNNKNSNARKITSYIAYRKYQIPVVKIAQFFKITSSSVSNMLEDGEKLYFKLNR